MELTKTKDTMEKMLMNKHTGSVDTLEAWKADYETAVKSGDTDLTWAEWSKDLVEVKKDEAGDWVEAE